jgi:IMP cyclohydrolase
MAYLGREIWLFLTDEGRPGALYSVSGRSKDSRERKAVYYSKESRVAIEPLDKSQKADSLRHYNAMKFNDIFLAVSNGLHTEDMLESRFGNYAIGDIPRKMRMHLNKWKPEPDTLKTPRIAGIVTYPTFYTMGMITEDNNATSIIVYPTRGTAYGISTYSGEGTEPKSFPIDRLLDQQTLLSKKVRGESPKDIAEFFVSNVIDPEFFVCCASALWHEEDDSWKIATLNKSG